MGWQTRLSTSNAVAATVTAVGCLLIVLAGVHLQSLVHINHDVAWIAHSAAWILEGKRFGTDILDPNPPLAWFLMMPAVAAARSGWLPEVAAIQAWSWIWTGMGIVLSAAVLMRLAGTLGRIESASLLLSVTAVVALLPISNFGQREIIAFALLVPYLFALAGRLCGASVQGRTLLILVGIGAGVGICMKPFLLAVPALAELLNLVLTRRLRALFRTETTVIALVVAAYAIAILLFARDYLEFALPLIRTVYWAYDDSGQWIGGRFREAAMPAAYAIGLTLATWSWTRLHGVLIAAIAGFSISYWVQNKGFPYHAYPILGASCVLLAYAVVRAIRAIHASPRITRLHLRLLAVIAVLLVASPVLYEPLSKALAWYAYADMRTGDYGLLRQAPIDRLRALGIRKSDYIYALSTHPFPGFPTANYLGVQWAGRAVSQFVIPAYVRRSEITDPAIRRDIERAAELQVAAVISDLKTHRPKYVMVDARPRRLGLVYRRFDDVGFYSRQPEFAELWNCYAEIKPIGDIRLFQLRDGCRIG